MVVTRARLQFRSTPGTSTGRAPAARDQTWPSMRPPLRAAPTAAGVSSEQAYFSAEQPPPPQEARLPASHAYPRRPRHSRRSPPQGPRADRGLRGFERPPLLMLPADNRMRRRQEFTLAVRRGKRAGRPRLVAHLLTINEPDAGGNPLVGFIVSKAVGNAVVRNRVQRRLRHLARDRIDRLPRGSLLVVR